MTRNSHTRSGREAQAARGQEAPAPVVGRVPWQECGCQPTRRVACPAPWPSLQSLSSTQLGPEPQDHAHTCPWQCQTCQDTHTPAPEPQATPVRTRTHLPWPQATPVRTTHTPAPGPQATPVRTTHTPTPEPQATPVRTMHTPGPWASHHLPVWLKPHPRPKLASRPDLPGARETRDAPREPAAVPAFLCPPAAPAVPPAGLGLKRPGNGLRAPSPRPGWPT